MSAPWSPMVAPPLVARNDLEWNTCPHGYPNEDCLGGVEHLDENGIAYYAAEQP